MQQVVDGTFVPPCFRLLGLRGVETREGAMTLAMPASAWLANAFGVLYGGATAFLADAAIILAAGTTVPAGTAFNSIDLKVYFLRPCCPPTANWWRAPPSPTEVARSPWSVARSLGKRER